jgi:glutamyl/glutaminyl-tRNA synthetase
MSELIAQFDLAKVNKSGAVLDTNKLDWLNSEYIRTKSDAELITLCKPYWENTGVDIDKFNSEYLSAIISLEKERIKKLSDLPELTKYFFVEQPELNSAALVWKKSTPEQTKQNLALLQDLFRITDDEVMRSAEKLEQVVKAFIADHELDHGSVLWPLRVAMTGEEKSPGPFEVTATIFLGLGRENLMQRLQTAISIL